MDALNALNTTAAAAVDEASGLAVSWNGSATFILWHCDTYSSEQIEAFTSYYDAATDDAKCGNIVAWATGRCAEVLADSLNPAED